MFKIDRFSLFFSLCILVLGACATSTPERHSKHSNKAFLEVVPDIIENELLNHHDELQDCYERYFDMMSEASKQAKVGEVVPSFMIVKGRVVEGSIKFVKDQIRSRSMRQCITDTFESMRFDELKGRQSLEVRFPLDFT